MAASRHEVFIFAVMTATFQPAASTSAQTLTTDQVLQQLQALLQPLGAVAEVETVALPDALDRVLAADVICPSMSLPMTTAPWMAMPLPAVNWSMHSPASH